VAAADRRRQALDPEIMFLAENLGATVAEVDALAEAGFDYLFNSNENGGISKSPWLLEQYERFRHIAPTIAFPESHDTERLVTELVAAGFPEGEIEARYRQAYAFAAAFSTGVMMPMGSSMAGRGASPSCRRMTKPKSRRASISAPSSPVPTG